MLKATRLPERVIQNIMVPNINADMLLGGGNLGKSIPVGTYVIPE